MGLPARRRMTVEEFLAWTPPDDGLRYELVEGFPVGQAWPSTPHGRITANLGIAIGTRLRSGDRPCAPEQGSTLRIDARDTVRAPDLLVRCGKSELEANDPVLAIEVVSPSNTARELSRRRRDYALAGIREVLEVEQDTAEVRAYRLRGEFWVEEGTVRDLGGEVRLESLDLTIPMAEIYRAIPLDEQA
ncbi:Uma2 family endonuclease [Aerophototrophica crusticola]|uniref:Uma2 family endonuclease n=1 Tax=Aerophototrophica crusticola TaxID=1709002 RepID=A0A858R8D3_9PROT|nr:Uma2 family endonuclease [Rhodospirillaceae bacterium B3]